MITVYAPAKINLSLIIVGKYPDGYHQLLSVMQKIDLCDSIDIEITNDGKIDFSCSDPSLNGEDNLVYRTAHLLQSCSSKKVGARIHLNKVIPQQAGLGGGSSDAGAVLLALNKYWDLAMDHMLLTAIASDIGSDIPFFLGGNSAVVFGRGEAVMPLQHNTICNLVLAKNNAGLSTGKVYQQYVAEMSGTEKLLNTISGHCGVKEALEQNNYAALCANLYNDLEKPAMELLPELKVERESMIAAGCDGVVLCGSGSAFCGICRDEEAARSAAVQLQSSFSWVCATAFLP